MSSRAFYCSECGSKFKTKITLNKHIRNRICAKQQFRANHPNAKVGQPSKNKKCEHCNKTFFERRNLLRHQQLYHSKLKVSYPCGKCSEFFASGILLDKHRKQAHPSQSEIYERVNILKGSCRVYRYDIKKDTLVLNSIIPEAHAKISEFLTQVKDELPSYKYCLVLAAEYEKIGLNTTSKEDTRPERLLMHFRSKTNLILHSDDENLSVTEALFSMENNAESFNMNGSGWILHSILHIDIEIGQCHVLAGGCSLHKIAQARNLKGSFEVLKKKGSNDELLRKTEDSGRCFFHAVASYFCNKETDIEKLEDFIANNLVMTGLSTPVRLSDISKFEELNAHLDFGINVINKITNEKIYPVYISKIDNPKNVINLLLFYVQQGKAETIHNTEIEVSKHFDEENDVNNWELYDEIDACSVQHYALIDNLEKEIMKARKNDFIERSYKMRNSLTLKIDKSQGIIDRCESLIQEYIEEMSNPSTKDDRLSYLKHHMRSDQNRRDMERVTLEELKKNLEKCEEQLKEYEELYNSDPNSTRGIRACYNCLSVFSNKNSLDVHKKWCFKEKPKVTLLPKAGERMEFDQKRKHVFSRIQMFFDFECLQVKPEYPCSCRPEFDVQCQESTSRQATFCKHKTLVENEQKPFYYCLLVCSNEFEIYELIEYYGEDANDHFLDKLLDMEKKYMDHIRKTNVPVFLTKEDNEHFNSCNICHICEKEVRPDEKKCLDHDHLSGCYVGVAHNTCNLQRRENYGTFPVYCHNFSNYDSHLIMSSISKKMDRIHRLSAIPLNSEKFKTIRINNLYLKDSMALLDGSLEKLVNTLVCSNHKFPLMRKVFPEYKKRELLLRKGVYPYEFVKSIEQLRNQTTLPKHEEFYSKLALQNISEDDYKHAQNVWNEFNCRNMLDYTKIYVVCDTVLLAEVIQTFRRKIYQEFTLDPVHYISLPSLAKDIMLKTSRCSLEMIHDSNMCYFFKSGIRGGLSFVNLRHCDIEELEKKTGESHALLYTDANALYGASMSLPLPLGDYRWLSEEEIKNLDLNSANFKNSKSHALEVTLEYPDELHLDHNSYPLAAEHFMPEEDDLSPYAKSCLEDFNIKFTKVKKLTATFRERKNYICHIMNLKLYVELGMKIKKIHSVVEFTQGDYMRQFVQNCAEKRRTAVTEMDSMIYKRLVNSVFGKVNSKIYYLI